MNGLKVVVKRQGGQPPYTYDQSEFYSIKTPIGEVTVVDGFISLPSAQSARFYVPDWHGSEPKCAGSVDETTRVDVRDGCAAVVAIPNWGTITVSLNWPEAPKMPGI